MNERYYALTRQTVFEISKFLMILMKPNIHVELTSIKKNIKNICKKATTQQPCLQSIYYERKLQFQNIGFVFGFIFMLEFHMLDLQLS